MTLPIARDLAAVGIRVCTIAPGLMDTPLLGLRAQPGKDGLGAAVLFPKRLGRHRRLRVARAGDRHNGYMNGEDVRLDGGIRIPPK